MSLTKSPITLRAPTQPLPLSAHVPLLSGGFCASGGRAKRSFSYSAPQFHRLQGLR